MCGPWAPLSCSQAAGTPGVRGPLGAGLAQVQAERRVSTDVARRERLPGAERPAGPLSSDPRCTLSSGHSRTLPRGLRRASARDYGRPERQMVALRAKLHSGALNILKRFP